MSAKERADGELADKLRARDPDAMAAVYDKYSGLAFSLLYRVTRDQSVAEDLVQELFLRVWNRSRDFDPQKGTLGVWILSIARNIAIDYVRSAQAKFQTRVRSIDLTDQISFSYHPQGPESTIDNARAVQAAFTDLTSNQKKVMEMAYFQGFSQSEIANELQEPLGTVKSWMRTAMERLRVAVKAGVTK